MKILYTTLLFCLLLFDIPFVSITYAQTRVIHGTVKASNTKQPLPGVDIVVPKHISLGTVTNANGEYSIKVPSNADTLIFSYTGYQTKQVPVKSRKRINVMLSIKNELLGKLVVTALGRKQQIGALGYSVQEVKGSKLTKVPSLNLMTDLTGRVAGLDIRSSTSLFQNPTILLRGRKPLLVINGIPDQTGNIWDINVNNIAKISVLKGATASALYGSIGQNGAIIVTTKQGQGIKGLVMKVNSSTLAQPSFLRVPHVQTTYGDGDNGIYKYINGSGAGPEGGGWIWGPRLNQKDPNTKSGYWETPQYNSPINPKTGKRIPIPFIARGKNNIQNFFRDGLLTSNNISATWGGKYGSLRMSVSQKYQRGIVPNTDLNTASFMIGGKADINPKLTVDGALTYNKEFTHNYPTVGYGPHSIIYNLVIWMGADVNVENLRNYWQPGQVGYQQRMYNDSWYNNPYFIAYQYLRGYHRDNTYGHLNMNYQLLPSLSLKLRTGGNTYALNRTTREPKSYITYGHKSKGNYYIAKHNYYNIVTNLSANYNHDFAGNFSVNAVVGASNNFSNQRSDSVQTDGLVIPQFYNLGNSISSLVGSNQIINDQINSLYGLANFSYKDTYYLSLTGRKDWVSTLPLGNNSFFYPSISGSVILSNLLHLPKLFSSLKVRGSWARVSKGIIGNNPYGYIQTYKTGTIWNNSPSLYMGNELKSKNLKPETSDTWETGMLVGLFNNRVSLDATYYQARDYNNLTLIPISDASGYNSKLVNGNVYKRKGWEFTLKLNPIKSSQFNWDLTANMSQNHRYLTQIYGGAQNLGYLTVGERTDRIYANVYETNSKGQVIYQKNGFPKSDPYKQFIGYRDPKWIYGVQNDFKYRQFALNVSVDGRIGGLMYSTTNYKMWWGGTAPGTVTKYRAQANKGLATYVGKGVVVTGGKVTYNNQGKIIKDTRTYAPNTKKVNYISFMIATGNSMNENYFYYSTTFLMLRDIALTYTLPSYIVHRLSLSSASVSLVGRNLLLLDKIPNVVPGPGKDNLQEPVMRSFGLNINFSF